MNTENLIWDAESQMWKNTNNDFVSEIFCDFEDIRFEGNAQNRYKLKHDATVSNFQYTVMESKTDTLGGKYPFIRRNGDTYYRQFSISGLITHFNENDYPDEYMAENILHTASNSDGEQPLENYFDRRVRERVAKNNNILKNKYDEYYYNDFRLNGYTDYLLEREYRDDVTTFFYEDKIRLFRSPTEGNILIKLMNVSLTPNEQIKRRVSTIQCTAYEIDDFSVEKCIEYKIWDDNKSIFTNLYATGIAAVHVGQLRHDDLANLESQDFGPYLKTDFYQEIIDDVKQHHQNENVFNIEKIIWMKSSFYSPSSYFGYDRDGKVTWAVLPNSPIISELIVSTEDTLNEDDNIEVEIRTYDINYPINDHTKLWTRFFNEIFSDLTSQAEAFISVFQQLQRLAYIIVRYCWGETFTYNNEHYSWDDINSWDSFVKDAFISQLVECDWKDDLEHSPLYTIDTNDNIVLKNKPAWAINTILQICSSGDLQSNAGLYVLRVGSGSGEDALLEKVEEVFEGLTIGTDGDSMAAKAMLGYSVDFMIEPFNGYWQQSNNNGGYEILPLEDNDYAKPMIDFWLTLAMTMAVYGEWGFGKASIENLRAKTLQDLTDGKPILLDANLTNNVLSSVRTTDINLIGHGMYINNELVVVPPQGYYELTDMDTSITQFSQQRLKDEPLKCLIDYAALYRSYNSEELNLMRRTVARYYKIGQIRTVTAEQDIINEIRERYARNDNHSFIEVLFVPYISIEAEPYTRIFLKDSADKEIDREAQENQDIMQEYIMNNDGIMTFYRTGTSIEKLYFDTYNDNNGPIENYTIEDRNEIVYNNASALNDVIVNYICLIKEIK